MISSSSFSSEFGGFISWPVKVDQFYNYSVHVFSGWAYVVVPIFWLSACAVHCDWLGVSMSVKVISDSELKFHIIVKLLWCNLVKYHVRKQTISVHCIGNYFQSALYQSCKCFNTTVNLVNEVVWYQFAGCLRVPVL